MVQSRGPEGVQIPVHTHPTTSTTTPSLFSQVNQVHTQQGNVNHTRSTQTVLSTCRTSNHTHQVRTAPGLVTFATTQRGPVSTAILQGVGLTGVGISRPMNLTHDSCSTSYQQPPSSECCEYAAVGSQCTECTSTTIHTSNSYAWVTLARTGAYHNTRSHAYGAITQQPADLCSSPTG